MCDGSTFRALDYSVEFYIENYGIMSNDIIRAEVRIGTTYHVRSTWHSEL